MSVVQPHIPGVAPERADAFVRWRVLAWRGLCRGPHVTARLSLVRCASINATDHLAEDIAWWDVPADSATRSDHGTRADVLRRLLCDIVDEPVVAVWARPGPNETTQSDLGWLAALRQEGGGESMTLVVITRWGWQSLPDGAIRTWKRIRAKAS